MDRISYRYLVDNMIHNKPKVVQDRIQAKIDEVLYITNKGFLSDETTAIIILQVEAEIEREAKCL